MGSDEAYTVKERIQMLADTIAEQFGSILRQLDTIERKLDEKASNSRVTEVERKVDDALGRILNLELGAAGAIAVSKFQRWLIGMGVVLVSAVIGSLIYLVASGVH